MAEAVQKHLEGADDSVIEARDGERVFTLSRNIHTQEKKKRKFTLQIQDMQLPGKCLLRRSATILECVQMFH